MIINLILNFFVEIGKVRGNLFQINGNEKKPMVLPDAVGAAVNLSEKVYVPVKEFPDVSVFLFSLSFLATLSCYAILFISFIHSFVPFLQFNFVGRILGPRGMTAKQLEQETGCKIMVRGRGSMRDKKKVVNLGWLPLSLSLLLMLRYCCSVQSKSRVQQQQSWA